MAMEKILELKEQGNAEFKAGTKTTNNENFHQACVKYGEAIELLIEYELNHTADSTLSVKLSLFSNLAAGNLKLNNYEGCRRCCNVVILFCNKPDLKLDDMGVDDDITQDIAVIKPILPTCQSILSKTLYRRGKCRTIAGEFQNAHHDFTNALHFASNKNDKDIKAALSELAPYLKVVSGVNNGTIDSNNDDERSDAVKEDVSLLATKQTESVDRSSMTVNGGPCLLRKGLWSQTVSEAVVCLPLSFLETLISPPQSSSLRVDSNSKQQKKSLWKVEFYPNEIRIFFGSIVILHESLAYTIVPKDSVWMIDDDDNSNDNTTVGGDNGQKNATSIGYLVLHLPKVQPSEWSPGCEWWERVFADDERIDTLTCTVNSDVTQLPVETRQRAEIEHLRFQSLSLQDQEKELQYLSHAKKGFKLAEERSREAAATEDSAVSAVPERAEMLDSLREEFPHIQFTAK